MPATSPVSRIHAIAMHGKAILAFADRNDKRRILWLSAGDRRAIGITDAHVEKFIAAGIAARDGRQVGLGLDLFAIELGTMLQAAMDEARRSGADLPRSWCPWSPPFPHCVVRATSAKHFAEQIHALQGALGDVVRECEITIHLEQVPAVSNAPRVRAPEDEVAAGTGPISLLGFVRKMCPKLRGEALEKKKRAFVLWMNRNGRRPRVVEAGRLAASGISAKAGLLDATDLAAAWEDRKR